MSISVRPSFHQCDPAGILFFGEVFHLTHDAYEQWVNQLGFSFKEWFNNPIWALPIKNCSADFTIPMTAGQDYDVTPSIVKVGNTSLQLLWDFSKEQNQHCRVQTTHVFVDKASGTKMPIPEKIKNCLIEASR